MNPPKDNAEGEGEMAAVFQKLEVLLTQFLDPTQANDMKQVVGQQLQEFKERSDVYEWAPAILGNTPQSQNSAVVQFFCASALETLVLRRWNLVPSDNRASLRLFLLNFLGAKGHTLANFVLEKISKVVVDIAKHDWPQYWPTFLATVIQAVQNESSRLFGLLIFRVLMEEVGKEGCDLSVSRRGDLRAHILSQSRSILGLFQELLDSLHSANTVPLSAVADQQETLYKSTFNTHSQNTVKTIMDIIVSLFAWAPSSDCLSPALLQSIFRYIRVDDTNIALSAFNCVNDIMGKSCVPKEFEEFLVAVFKQIFYLLRNFHSNPTLLVSASDDFLEKFTLFVRLFFENHLHRVEGNVHFPMTEFLGLFYSYTMNQPSPTRYLECLEVWDNFLAHVLVQVEQTAPDDALVLLNKYGQGVTSLFLEVLKRIQHEHYGSQLSQMDDEDRDTETLQTERDTFIAAGIETTTLCVDLYGDLLSEHLLELLERNATGLVAVYEGAGADCASRTADFVTSTKLLGRCSDYFCSKFADRFAQAQKAVLNLLKVVQFLSSVRILISMDHTFVSRKGHAMPQNVRVRQDDTCQKALSECFGALRAFTSWISQFHAHVQFTPGAPTIPSLVQVVHQDPAGFRALVTSVADATCTVFVPGFSDGVVMSAALLLRSLADTVRSSAILESGQVGWLLQNAVSLGNPRSLEIQMALHSAVTSLLLVPFSDRKNNDPEQQWVQRRALFSTIVSEVIAPILQLGTQLVGGVVETPDVIVRATPHVLAFSAILTSVCDRSATLASASKSVVFSAIDPALSTILVLFRRYIQDQTVTRSLLDLMFSLLKSLHKFVGVPFIESTLRAFLDLFSGDRLAQFACSEDEIATAVIKRMLCILNLLLEVAELSLATFFPDVLSFVLSELAPLFQKGSANPDLCEPFYDLIHVILLHNWRHFFSGSFDVPAAQSGEQLSELLLMIGRALEQTDINTFRQNLEALESLNDKRKLFQRKFFKESFLQSFVETLLTVMVYGTHDLLRDELANMIYAMASIDFDVFFSHILKSYLSRRTEISLDQKSTLLWSADTDLPTFTKNLSSFTLDYRHHMFVNTKVN